MEALKRLLLLGPLALAGCELTRDPTGLELDARPVGVYSVLRAGADTVSVLVVRYREEFQLFEPGFEPVAGAEVRIVAGGDTLRLRPGSAECLVAPAPGERPVDAAPGCYAAGVPGGVRPAERYELLVRLPGGETVRGATQVPRAPELLAPAEDARLTPTSEGRFVLRLGFDAPPEAGLVTLTLTAVEEACEISPEDETIGPGEPIAVGGAGRDSAVVRVRAVRCAVKGVPVRRDTVPARLLLTAFDTAYARYRAQVLDKQSVLERRASAGVSGAVGVFAGAAASERRVVFVPAR